jgi:AraC-like DNA-binding protein
VVTVLSYNEQIVRPIFYSPGPPLDALVECLCYFPSYRVEHERERALPTGTIELVFDLAHTAMRIFRDEQDMVGQHFNHAVVCGPHSRYFVFDTLRSGPVLGVHFRPGGAFPFFPCPAYELSERTVALEDLWVSETGEMQERLLAAASSPNHMFRTLEDMLRSHLRKTATLHPVVAYAVQKLVVAPDLQSIRKLQDDTGYSPKRFIELFNESVGLTPKVFSRIQRFQSAITRIARGDRVDWAGVAADNGYCDQSHLNREFRVFSGVTPAQYRPVSKQRPSHVPV